MRWLDKERDGLRYDRRWLLLSRSLEMPLRGNSRPGRASYEVALENLRLLKDKEAGVVIMIVRFSDDV